MPEDEYPHFDDPRIHMDQPGVYFDLPLASYITNPPDLTKKGAKHNVNLPDDMDDLETLGFNSADGAEQQGTTIPLETNTGVRTLVDARAFSDARLSFDTADKLVRNAYCALKIARDNARGWLMMAVGLLKPALGAKPSAAWTEAGWSDESLAVPHGEDKLMPMLRKQKTYLTNNASLQVNDPRVKYTAARADELLTAIQLALTNTDETNGKILGVEPAEVRRDGALNTRNLAEESLRRRLRGLYGELEQKIAADSPLWIVFGFDQPGSVNAPDPVAALTAEAFGSGRGKLSWTGAMRATRYQVFRQKQGESGFKLYDRTDGATEMLLEDLTIGTTDKWKVRGVNDTNYGRFSPEVELTVT